MGFTRRYSYNPGLDVLSQVEGIVLLDQAPDAVGGSSESGVVCAVGECADMTYAVSVNGSGNVTTKIRPQLVSGNSLEAFIGRFDPTLGDFGRSCGNLVSDLVNKTFASLVVAPVNLASSKGARFFRSLPLCKSATDPTPVVPVEAATLLAGTVMNGVGSATLKVASRVTFTSYGEITAGTGGATSNSGSAAATQSFTVAGVDFPNVRRPDGSGYGVKKGDIVVIGNDNGGAISPLPASGDLGGGTYRVAVDSSSGTSTVLVLEALNGADFDFITATSVPYRVHVSSDADSAPVVVYGSTLAGGYVASEAGGCTVAVRPLTSDAGVASVDGTWAANTALAPQDPEDGYTGSTWSPFSNLAGFTHATDATPYTLDVQGANAAASAALDAAYITAIEATAAAADPVSSINIIFASRKSVLIANALRQNVNTAYGRYAGRIGISSPALSIQTNNVIVSDTAPGVGANRDDKIIYAWPGYSTFIKAAVGSRLAVADGTTVVNGILDISSDSLLASIMSVLPPENNPGQTAAPVPSLMAGVLGIQRGVAGLELDDYVLYKSKGICALAGSGSTYEFYSGITTSLTAGRRNILRRRMSFFIQDGMAAAMKPFNKLRLTEANKNAAVLAAEAYMSRLFTPGSVSGQRIEGYTIDPVSGNTAAAQQANLFVIKVIATLTRTGDTIVLDMNISESSNVSVVEA